MRLRELAHFPTEIPFASFLPIGFLISFTRQDNEVIEIYEVIESGVEISSNIECRPNTMFRVQRVGADSSEQYYCFTAPLESHGPTGMMGFACLVGKEPLGQTWGANTLVFPREDIIATLLHIIDLRMLIRGLGVDDGLLCQRLWPLAIENTRWHTINTGLAQYTARVMRDSAVTDGHIVIEPDNIGDGCWIVLKDCTYLYINEPTALLRVTKDVEADVLFSLIRRYPAV